MQDKKKREAIQVGLDYTPTRQNVKNGLMAIPNQRSM